MMDESPVAVAHRINGERLVVLGWSRAILMQLAHPLVAAGVYEHSGFRRSPLAAVTRLRATVAAMLAIAFGDRTRQANALDGIRAIHRRVRGTLSETVGAYPVGTTYSAEDPALLLWVHTTLIESTVLTYHTFVRELSEEERDVYCEASADVPVALGAIDADVPRTWRDLTAMNARLISSPAIVVGPHALALSRALLDGTLMRTLVPAGWLNRTVTVGLMPSSLRADYGFAWTARNARTFARLATTLRRLRRVTPAVAARFADARMAAGHGAASRTDRRRPKRASGQSRR